MKQLIYLLSLLLIGLFTITGCSDLGTENSEEEIIIKELPEESVSLTGEAALQQMIKDLKEHPEIIDQINKNREVPVMAGELIKEYQNKIVELRKKPKETSAVNGNTVSTWCSSFSWIGIRGVQFKSIEFGAMTGCDSKTGSIGHILNYKIYRGEFGQLPIGGGKFEQGTFFDTQYYSTTDRANFIGSTTITVDLHTKHKVHYTFFPDKTFNSFASQTG